MALTAEACLSFAVEADDASQVGAARRFAARIAEGAALPETLAGHLAIVVVELATNLVKHARRGELLIQATGTGGRAVVDVLSIDHGPGMDLDRCFRDGYSTGGSSGTGLGAVRRLATTFDAHSDARGTVMLARFGAGGDPAFGSLSRPLRGEFVCGDSWRLATHDRGYTIAVCDGLGHGQHAHAAARAALTGLDAAPSDPVRTLERAHAASAGTRGSACTVVCVDTAAQRLLHAGIGNVAATVIGRDGARGLPSQSGTLGAACPRIQLNTVDVAAGMLLVLHSDGLTARWSLDAYPGLRMREPQLVAGVLWRDANRRRDDATIVVIRL